VSATRVGTTGWYRVPPTSVVGMDADAGEALSTAANAPKEAARGSRRPTLSASRPRPLLLPGLSAEDRENNFMTVVSLMS